MTIVTSSRKTSRTRDPERSQAAILLAARQEFVEHGFSGARTGEIAKRAGVPQGLLYHYFESKEALFGAVMNDALAPYFRATIDLLENPPGGDAGPPLLEAAIRMYFEFLAENPHVVRLMTWWTANQGWKTGPPMARDDLCEKPMILGAQRIREAQEAGLIRSELEPEHVIRLFLNLCMHWHMEWEHAAFDQGVDLQDEAAVTRLHETHLQHIVDVLLRGVLAPAPESR
jgi:TetR/AcrR family transcriptional regulator